MRNMRLCDVLPIQFYTIYGHANWFGELKKMFGDTLNMFEEVAPISEGE